LCPHNSGLDSVKFDDVVVGSFNVPDDIRDGHVILAGGDADAAVVAFLDLVQVIEMLELGERYFSPKENPDDIESEYDEIDYEPEISNWRFV